MKKFTLLVAALFLGMSLYAQGPIKSMLKRFEDPDKGHVTFIKKGNRAVGIGGSYKSYTAGGTVDGDGYSILSILNIGDGQFSNWNVTPSFHYFLADDFSLGVALNYTGYLIDTNIKLDFRSMLSPFFEEEADLSSLNVQLSSRHMYRHKGGLAITARKYLSFFGSQTFGVFAEGRLYGNYGMTHSNPRTNVYKIRTSRMIDLGFKIAGGLAVRLRDNSAFTVSIPVVGIAWSQTKQTKSWLVGENQARMSSFQIARNVDALGIQIGYIRYIAPKK